MIIKRILYISRINLVSGRTNVYNVAKTCESINAQTGYSVKLLTTDQKKDVDTFFHKMGVKTPFNIMFLGLTDTTSKYVGRFGHTVLMFIYINFFLWWYLVVHRKEFDVVYYRDELLFPSVFCVGKILRKSVFFEIHLVLEKRFRQLINLACVKFADGVIAISSELKHFYQKTNNNIFLSLCSAAEDSWFDYSQSKRAFREELGLPKDVFIVGYTGVVGVNPNNDYYELDDIARSLVLLPKDIIYVVVGELHPGAQWLRDIAQDLGVSNRVIIVPWQDRSRIPKYLQSFDVNIIPKRKKDQIGDTPAKIFPALASRQPIVAGCAAGILEVLTDGVDAAIVDENSSEGWAKAILKIYKNPVFAKKISDGAWITKNKYTWPNRGAAISEFIHKITQ